MAVYAQVDKQKKPADIHTISTNAVSIKSLEQTQTTEDRSSTLGTPTPHTRNSAFYTATDTYEEINVGRGNDQVEEVEIEDQLSLQSESSDEDTPENSPIRAGSPVSDRNSGEYIVTEPIWGTIPATSDIDYEDSITTKFWTESSNPLENM